MLSDDDAFGALVKASYFSNDGNKQSVSVYGKVTESVNVLASYVNVSRENMEDGDGKIIPGTAADQTLSFVKVNAELTNNQELTVSSHPI